MAGRLSFPNAIGPRKRSPFGLQHATFEALRPDWGAVSFRKRLSGRSTGFSQAGERHPTRLASGQVSREQQQYFESMLEITPTAVVTLDVARRVTAWNRAAVELFG